MFRSLIHTGRGNLKLQETLHFLQEYQVRRSGEVPDEKRRNMDGTIRRDDEGLVAKTRPLVKRRTDNELKRKERRGRGRGRGRGGGDVEEMVVLQETGRVLPWLQPTSFGEHCLPLPSR